MSTTLSRKSSLGSTEVVTDLDRSDLRARLGTLGWYVAATKPSLMYYPK